MNAVPAGSLRRASAAHWIVGAYVVFGAAWIVGSDFLLAAVTADPAVRHFVGNLKGLAFVAVSAGWGLALWRLGAPRQSTPRDDSRPSPHRLVAVLLGAALVVPAVDLAIVQIEGSQELRSTLGEQRNLAELRANQVDAWLDEHVDRAERLAALPYWNGAFEPAGPRGTSADYRERMAELALGNHYNGIRLHAADGSVLAEAGNSLPRLPGDVLIDLEPRRGGARGIVHGVLRASADHHAAFELRVAIGPHEHPLGWLDVELSPDPLLERPAGPGDGDSRTIVVGAIGADVIHLGLLNATGGSRIEFARHPRDADPIARAALAALRAGDVEGTTADGTDVLAGYAPLADSSWRVVAMVERDTAYGALMPLIAWVTSVLLITLGIIAGLLIALWRSQRGFEDLRAATLQHANERLLRNMFEMPFVGVAFTSPTDGRALACNQCMCEILGYGQDELRSIRWPDITHPDDRAADDLEFARVLAGTSDGYRREKRFVRKDGAIIHARVDLRCARRGDGGIESIAATIEDITDDVRRRTALQDSEARWRRIVAETPVPTCVHREDGTVLALSLAWTESSGYPATAEDGGTRTVADWLALFYSPQQASEVAAHVHALFAADGRIESGDFVIRHADGTPRTWWFTSTPIGRDADGRRLVVTAAIDVTTQRAIERELRESAHLYQQMFDSNPVCMYAWDAETHELLAVNDAMIDGHGWSRDEMLRMRLEDLRPACELERLQTALARLVRDASNPSGTWVHQRRDGTLMRMEITVHAMQFGERDAWLTMAVDVTEREAARAERDDYVRRLEAATDSTFQVISTMVEMRDPYTAGHERRVGELAASIAAELGLSEHTQKGLRLCGTVHDVGKIGIPSEILCKPSRLSPAEYMLVQQHAALGYEILKTIELPWPIAEVARQHHEAIDGSGYPRGLKGDEILLEARIVAVADVVESMATHRPYRAAKGIDRALAQLQSGRGRLYDPAVVDACLALFRERDYQLPT